MTPPPWSEEIRQLYLSGAANQFVVFGNVGDRLLVPVSGSKGLGAANGPGEAAVPSVSEDSSGAGGVRIGNLADFLVEVQLRRFDIVFVYELGAGLRVARGGDFLEELRYGGELPKEPAQAIAWLDGFLRYCVNLRALQQSDGGQSGRAVGRNHHVAIVLKSAELVFPVSRQTRDYQLNSMAAVVRSWSRESHFLEQNLAVLLVADHLHDLHHLLAQNPRAARIEIPTPGAAEMGAAFEHFAGLYPVALERFARDPSLPALRLAGATLGSTESLLKRREHERRPLEERDLADLKKSLVERDAQGLIDFVEPRRTLDDVHGHEAVKTWMRQDIALWQAGDLGAMPMGYLLSGPVGTGKTYLVECLAGEAGVPVVKMKNFRDRWVGSTEGNLEKIFSLLHALGRCIVFVDEADQALGSRTAGSGDSGVSGRVYSMIAEEMSNSANRGRILWILASSRPDLIEIDLKRPGRVDVKLPLFPSHEPEEAYALIRSLARKHRLELPEKCPEDLLPLVPDLVTPGAAEAIAMKVYRLVRTAAFRREEDPPHEPARLAPEDAAGPDVAKEEKGAPLDPLAALRSCLDEYQNPVPLAIMEFQIGLAVAESSDLAFVPEAFRKAAPQRAASS